jgi:hypothetical protein
MWQLFFKMCVRIETDKKAQECPGLPPNWRFMFVAPKDNTGIGELALLTPSGRKYRSLDKAKKVGGKLDVAQFCACVGLEIPANVETARPPQVPTLQQGLSQQGPVLQQDLSNPVCEAPLDPTELWQNKCGECEQCTRTDCKTCNSCLRNARQRKKECCLRRVGTLSDDTG